MINILSEIYENLFNFTNSMNIFIFMGIESKEGAQFLQNLLWFFIDMSKSLYLLSYNSKVDC